MTDSGTMTPPQSESSEVLRELVLRAVLAHIHPLGWRNLGSEMSAIGVQLADRIDGDSKERILSRTVASVATHEVVSVARAFVRRFPFRSGHRRSFELEEAIARPWSIGLNKKARREIANSIGRDEIFLNANGLMELVRGLFPLTVAGGFLPGIDDDIERHVIRNQDWDVATLFEAVGAFNVSERRFADFVEGILHHEVRPDEADIRALAERIQRALVNSAAELREVGDSDGYPSFKLVARTSTPTKPKNLIFASTRKPDLRLIDALSNDIEVVTRADEVLIYDQEFPAHGLLWRDLQAWFADSMGVENDEAAKKSLYRRLRSCLPATSPPQLLVFDAYHEFLGARTPASPALLPEVWLHWDPKSVVERGASALPRFRMDFLLLLPGGVRVVLEVDGKQHYADGDVASPSKYATMVAEDRALSLAGYEVYRFGGAELSDGNGQSIVSTFVERLFRKHRVEGV